MALILFVEYHSAFRQAASHVMDQEPRAGELIGRYHELRDTPLGLFGIELIFVQEVLIHRLVVAFSSHTQRDSM